MRSVNDPNLTGFQEAEVRFVNQRRRLEQSQVTIAPEPGTSKPVQFAIEHREQLVQSYSIAAVRPAKHFGE